MAFNLINLLSTISTPATQSATAVSSNIDNNPFTQANFNKNKYNYYGKNRPIPGGYFAGYYNGKPNIVGRKLFIEV